MSDMTTTEVLQAARDKIANPKQWANGALCYAGGSPRDGMNAYDILAFASLELFKCMPEIVNDTGDHGDMMRMYDRAIQMSKESK